MVVNTNTHTHLAYHTRTHLRPGAGGGSIRKWPFFEDGNSECEPLILGQTEGPLGLLYSLWGGGRERGGEKGKEREQLYPPVSRPLTLGCYSVGFGYLSVGPPNSVR